jgi:hypothetical protein
MKIFMTVDAASPISSRFRGVKSMADVASEIETDNLK